MKAGDICEGVVTRIEHFGLFVEVDGVSGLIRVVELTWDYIRHPSDIASIGDRVRFQVFNLNDPIKSPHEQFNGSMKILIPRPPNECGMW